MIEGIIDAGTERGNSIGFTEDKFSGYLWFKDGYIYLPVIISKEQGRGHLSDLMNKILSLGYGIKIMTPSARMKAIVEKKGFTYSEVYDETYGDDVEVWTKEATDGSG